MPALIALVAGMDATARTATIQRLRAAASPAPCARTCSPQLVRLPPGRVTGVTVQQQRLIAKAVKNAREAALLPYASRTGT
ncbi:hypothetical protein AB0K12_46650 [Nonomuraea sp. NPDC049419]|uniref:hypothetical protein n=1 Tax=Nonomuraea sp. NPDC049419 TaxID=3155772 RepID=UPI003414ED88